MDDIDVLRKELDRVEGRVFDFGSFRGWTVENVARVNPSYLYWCLETVSLRPALARSILRVLAQARRSRTRRTVGCGPTPPVAGNPR